MGDYTLEGCEERFAIERKSPVDFIDTLLGYADNRRNRFFEEVKALAAMDRGIVIIEATFGLCVAMVEDRGQQTAQTRRRALMTTLTGCMVKHGVPFLFCDDRRAAEVFAFRWLRGCYERQIEKIAR